jgi:hypothetical protein
MVSSRFRRACLSIGKLLVAKQRLSGVQPILASLPWRRFARYVVQALDYAALYAVLGALAS